MKRSDTVAIMKSRIIGSTVVPLWLALPGVVLGQTTPAELTELALQASLHDAERLAPAVPTATVSFPVADADSAVFDIASTSPGVGVSLVDPAGNRFDESSIALVGGRAERQTSNADEFLIGPLQSPGEHVTFFVPAPITGQWVIELAAPAANTEEIAVSVSLIMTSPTAVGLLALPQESVLGESTSLTLAGFTGSSPLTQGTAEVQLLDPGGVVTSLLLRDDGVDPDDRSGDGLFSAALTPSRAGVYTALATYRETSPAGELRRQASARFEVVPVSLSIMGTLGTRTVDANLDGLIEEVVLDLGVQVLTPGDYLVQLTATATNGASLLTKQQSTVTSATSEISIVLSAQEVRGLGVDGPFTIGPVAIDRLGTDRATVADRVASLGQTSPLLLSDFERPPIEVTGSLRDRGLDVDANGRFDFLDIEIDVRFSASSFYQWSATLFDRAGAQIGFANGSNFYSPGVSTLVLRFRGTNIGSNGIDGPFVLGNLLVNGGGDSLVELRVGQTSARPASDFEGFQPNLPPVADAGVDQTLEATTSTGTRVVLDGSGSSDPEGASLSYRWVDERGTVVGNTSVVPLELPLGTQRFQLTVTDPRLQSASDEVLVVVQDTTPPVVSVPSGVSTESPDGSPLIVSFEVLALDNLDGVVPASCSPASGSTFALGETSVSCSATDRSGNLGQASFLVRVTRAVGPSCDFGANPIERVVAFTGTDLGKQGTGLRLTSMGRYTSPESTSYTVWRVRNASNLVRTVRIDGYGSGWAFSFDAPPKTESFVMSSVTGGAATHRLFEGGRQLDVKAASPSIYRSPVCP